MSKRLRNILILVAVLVVIIAASILVNHGKNGSLAVTIVTLKPQRFVVKLPENGILSRPGIQAIPALVGGNLGSLSVRAGQYVYAGKLLATVQNPSLQSSAASSQADYQSAVANISTARIDEQNSRVQYQGGVATAKSNLGEAQRIFNADASLFANKAIAKSQFDADRAKLDQARVAYHQALEQLKLGAVSGYGVNSVQSAKATAQKLQIVNSENQQQLGFTNIVAPFAGRILTVASTPSDSLAPIRVGDPVSTGQALFTISRGDAWIVRTKVDEQDVAQVHLGMRVRVSGEDFGKRKFYGRITAIAPTAQQSNDPSSTARQVLTTVQLDGQAPFFKDGMSVNVDILTTDMRSALSIPTTAIVRVKHKPFVYVVEKGIASKRAVVLGVDNGISTIIKSGVTAGESVVIKPSPLLTDKAHVMASTPSPSPAPSAS